MRVICINSKTFPESTATCDLVEGEIYTVIEIVHGRDIYGKIYPFGAYFIEEGKKGYGYAKERFTPLSDIDETIFEREYTKEKIGS